MDLPDAPRTLAYVGLGANLGDAPATLAAGLAALSVLPGSRLAAVSRLYLTRPVGVVDQPSYHNAVAALDVPAGPDPATGALALLGALKSIERAFGRRPRERWGPRELDLDLLLFGPHRVRVERPPGLEGAHATPDGVDRLEVPHASAHERLFVLAPLADLAPGLVPPGWDEDVATAARRALAVEGPGAVTPVADWDEQARGWRSLRREPQRAT
jgi:2-amino-4-hydroxy-6-hydroxymethyldihydropteridine diphosphokinase